MKRSARLMANELDKHSLLFRSDMKEIGKWDVQPGDEMTGWEIIAGLPLEYQLKGGRCQRYIIPSASEAYWFNSNRLPKPSKFIEIIPNKLYHWNSESWEAVEP